MATRSFAETGGPSPRQARSSLLTSSRTVLLSLYVLPICLLCEFSPMCPIGWTTRLLWPGKRYCSIHVYQELTGTVRATFPQRHQRLYIRPQNHSAPLAGQRQRAASHFAAPALSGGLSAVMCEAVIDLSSRCTVISKGGCHGLRPPPSQRAISRSPRPSADARTRVRGRSEIGTVRIVASFDFIHFNTHQHTQQLFG